MCDQDGQVELFRDRLDDRDAGPGSGKVVGQGALDGLEDLPLVGRNLEGHAQEPAARCRDTAGMVEQIIAKGRQLFGAQDPT